MERARPGISAAHPPNVDIYFGPQRQCVTDKKMLLSLSVACLEVLCAAIGSQTTFLQNANLYRSAELNSASSSEAKNHSAAEKDNDVLECGAVRQI
jgi:hypothetical protein